MRGRQRLLVAGVHEAAMTTAWGEIWVADWRAVGLSAEVPEQFRIGAEFFRASAKLAEVPSTAQIVAAMEQLLSKTMTSLDDRLSTQAHSIEVLKTTVSQTDSLLERVLESLDSLQTYTDPAELSDDVLLARPAV